VGSFPKPDYLVKARNAYAKGQISKLELERLEKQATKEWIDFQVEIGIDVLVDGEMYRGDMATYFAENLEGFEISGLVRSYGNRYYRKPIAVGPIRRTRPITLSMFEYAQSLTDRPVKGMLTGPYTMTDWSFNEYYSDRRSMALALAEAIHQEAVDLERAGAKYIQIDEPATSTRPEEIDLVIEALGIVTDGLKAHTITHICYGDFETIYPKMLELPVDQIDLEMANSNYDLLELFRKHPFTKYIGYGVIDVHSHRIETVEEVKRGIYLGLEILKPEQMYIDPDCGLKTRTVEEAKAKLRVMVEAVRQVRAELGLD
jgi:5-methyltetrahydropteroyltriglutamate--homocysteine methyltransferase